MSKGLLTPKLGLHNVISDISGEKIRSDKVRRDWRGIISSKEDWSPKHPQLTLRPRNEKINVSNPRTRPVDKFVTSVDPDSLNQR